VQYSFLVVHSTGSVLYTVQCTVNKADFVKQVPVPVQGGRLKRALFFKFGNQVRLFLN
jgi:hypothetical protein